MKHSQETKPSDASKSPVPPSDNALQPRTNEQATGKLSPKPSTLNPRKVPWGPWAGIVYAAFVFLASQFLVAFVLYAIADARGLKGSAVSDWLATVPLQFVFILFAEVLTFGAIVWFVRRQKATLGQIGLTKFRWMHAVWALSGFAVYFVAYIVLYAFVAKYVPGINVNQEQDIGFKDVSGFVPLALTFVSLVVLPPIVEETVFRGFIFSGLRGKYRFILAALVTSALFATAHLEFGNGKPLLWIAAIDTFTLSMVLCYIREKTGSIVPTIFIHAIKNCLAFLVLYIFVT
ncbi:CPBP family intramembrane metalloprotease [Candidatus Saccharibacteria bacterium]|nr:MAG: CPBP family intramembrane metalloprotease [Candidatus Saccharibacteria bacterium]